MRAVAAAFTVVLQVTAVLGTPCPLETEGFEFINREKCRTGPGSLTKTGDDSPAWCARQFPLAQRLTRTTTHHARRTHKGH